MYIASCPLQTTVFNNTATLVLMQNMLEGSFVMNWGHSDAFLNSSAISEQDHYEMGHTVPSKIQLQHKILGSKKISITIKCF